MKSKIMIGLLVVGIIGVGAKGVNAITSDKAKILGELTNKQVVNETNTKTYNEIAKQNSVIEEVNNYEVQKTLVETSVNDGSVTNSQDNVIYNHDNHSNHYNETHQNHSTTHNNGHNGIHR